jgi:hypothetical protein
MKFLDKIRQHMSGKPSGGLDAAKCDETPSSWRRLRWFESVRALQDAGFDVKRDPRGFWRVQMALPKRIDIDWYEPKKKWIKEPGASGKEYWIWRDADDW